MRITPNYPRKGRGRSIPSQSKWWLCCCCCFFCWDDCLLLAKAMKRSSKSVLGIIAMCLDVFLRRNKLMWRRAR